VEYFDYSGADPEFQDFDIEEFLERSQSREAERLEKELERIDRQLEKRDEIHRDALDELKSKRDWYIDRLKTLYRRPTDERDRQEEVKQRIEEIYRDLRGEKRARWRDRQELERERREILRELNEVEDTDIRQLL
jgi:trichohyalin